MANWVISGAVEIFWAEIWLGSVFSRNSICFVGDFSDSRVSLKRCMLNQGLNSCSWLRQKSASRKGFVSGG